VSGPVRRAPIIVVSLGAVVRAAVLALLGIATVALVATGALGRVAGGTTVADGAAVGAQQEVAVRDLQRGYELNVEQIRKVRALKLAIPAAQADAIATKALADLATLRHSALLTLAQVLALPGDPEAFAKRTEQLLDAPAAQTPPSAAPVLLAPRLYGIVARFDQLAAAISDKATTDLTQSPAPAHTPSPTPTR
jgi:hypothetical protein